ncbi:hypothetical protein B0T21DRAFT_395882 [Apiosordaria backusii]|uniref:Nuclear pore assembly and biogenesis-domain-containing protein n=1 Tax=Apiosordaria backusii TaxID=314023 RepID=A0AA40AN98_9PEZI|nr:hypothetical protein B0T21DRAFT_395882 [Apiosordaria backusii]
MANIPLSYLVHLLEGILPPSAITFLQTHLLDPTSPFNTTLTKSYSFLSNFLTYQLWPVLEPTMDKLAAYLHDSPQIISVAVLLGVIFLVVQILSFVNRVIRFWTRMAMRLVFWSFIGVLVSMAWQRGLEQSVKDVVVLGSAVYGWVQGVVGVWVREYEAAQRAGGGQQGQGQGYGGSKGGYGRY